MFPTRAGKWSYEALAGLVRRLQKLGPSAVVDHRDPKGPDLVNAMAEGEGEVSFLSRKAAGEERPGTGDVFPPLSPGMHPGLEPKEVC